MYWSVLVFFGYIFFSLFYLKRKLSKWKLEGRVVSALIGLLKDPPTEKPI